ncbi:MAG TPA: DUF2785 domain-containing protein [Anaerovoracaceae bacterium]|nr:DUF2785 domain-containing protein [Anaerovoracaceae bacterium]
MNLIELKELFNSIRQNQYKPPLITTIDELLPIFLDNIGNPDGDLRDRLIYDILSEWIYQGVYNRDQTLDIVSILMDENHLFSGLGTKDNDTLFTRSFSVLQLWAVLFTHHKEPFLPQETILQIANNVLILLEQEKDLRGYIQGNGWGHCIAHSADCIAQLVKDPQLEVNWHAKFMRTIISKVLEADFIYTGDECERLAGPAAEIILRRSSSKLVLDEFFDDLISTRKRDGIHPQQFFRFVNARDFLRGIYFYLRNQTSPQDLIGWIDQKLFEISQRS